MWFDRLATIAAEQHRQDLIRSAARVKRLPLATPEQPATPLSADARARLLAALARDWDNRGPGRSGPVDILQGWPPKPYRRPRAWPDRGAALAWVIWTTLTFAVSAFVFVRG